MSSSRPRGYRLKLLAWLYRLRLEAAYRTPWFLLALGLLIYFAYGIRNSRLAGARGG